ncbi:MAG: bifunctional oligoribonuclease/PAP phosphatase NrnA [Thermodesulfobacteria bacterium]|nr:bifunctional oligoribonuclease/PAP phosphatase NrnA [Thermodesulfobacteriota bacterium]
MEEDFLKLREIIHKEKNFFLTTHLNPDLDGVSAIVAFCWYLRSLGKDFCACIERLPRNAKFLPGREFLTEEGNCPELKGEEVVLVFDANTPSRIPDKIFKATKKAKYFVVIDHHYLEEGKEVFPRQELSIIAPEVASTTLLLLKYFKTIGFEITPEVATNLMAGLYFDTGGFKFENANKCEVFKCAEELCLAGAKPSLIAREIFENIPFDEVIALKKVISRTKFVCKDVVTSYLTAEDFKELSSKNIEYLSNFLRSIEGVNVSALVKEVEPGFIAVSLRSRAPVEVLEFAQSWGGGGHKYASGFKVQSKSLEDFLLELENRLRSYYCAK